jgi:acetylornithine deacetylase ArgE
MTPSDILCELISRPSVNPMVSINDDSYPYESPVSDWLENFFRSIGAPYERIEIVKNRANVIARFDAKESDKTILLDAHQDTVPVAGMTIEPFRPTLRDGRIYGRGACDVKGGMAAILHAFARLHRERPEKAANVIVSCTCDEESTIIGIQNLVSCLVNPSGKSKLLKSMPDFAIVAEPTSLDIVVAHLGVLRFRVRTLGRSCHSSDPTQGLNAIYKMAKVLGRLEEIAQSLPLTTPRHPMCRAAALSVGIIHGGTSVNIVPAECVIEVDRRLSPGERPHHVWEQLRDEIKQIDPTATCDAPFTSCPALGDEINQPLADQMLMTVSRIVADRAKVAVPYCTHASSISDVGIPTIVFGPGSIDQAHTSDEFIKVQQLKDAAEAYYRFCASGYST